MSTIERDLLRVLPDLANAADAMTEGASVWLADLRIVLCGTKRWSADSIEEPELMADQRSRSAGSSASRPRT